jgi:hypothetical protein
VFGVYGNLIAVISSRTIINEITDQSIRNVLFTKQLIHDGHDSILINGHLCGQYVTNLEVFYILLFCYK